MFAPIEILHAQFISPLPESRSITRHLEVIRSLARPGRLWFRFFHCKRSFRQLSQHGAAAVLPILDLIDDLEDLPHRFSSDKPLITYPFWIPYFVLVGPFTAAAKAKVHLFDVIANIEYGDVDVERRLREMLVRSCHRNDIRLRDSRSVDKHNRDETWTSTPFNICNTLIAIFPEYDPHRDPSWPWPSKNVDDVLTNWEHYLALPYLHAEHLEGG